MKQGGIICPVLFNVCMDDLRISLNNSGSGAHIGNKMYASHSHSFSVARMRYRNSARMNKLDFTTEKFSSVHMTVFEIVAHHNVDNWTQLLK